MFIKITKLQKWPKEDFALVTRPWWLPVYWQARSLEHASRTYSHATRAWQSGLWSPRGVIEREAQRITFTQLFWQRSTRTCSVQAQTDDCPCGALVMYARGQTQGSQLPVHVIRSALLNEWGGAMDARESTRSISTDLHLYCIHIIHD